MLTNGETEASGARDGAAGDRPAVSVSQDGDRLECVLSGHWITRTVAGIEPDVRALEDRGSTRNATLDLSDVGKIDTAGAWLIDRLARALHAQGAEVSLVGQSAAARILLSAIGENADGREPPKPAPRTPLLLRFPEWIGRGIYGFRDDFVASMYILGSTIRGSQMKLGRGHGVNLAAIFNQIDRMGVGAIPVVMLMSFIVGAIVAQQGAFQLRYFGAEIFVVDLVGILVLRELGVLMTAIMIAGRSGSAITAEIGSMKMREEVDALKVIGLNPIGVLVFPRLVALVIGLPCLTILANFAALGGAITVGYYYSNIDPQAFIDRLRVSIDLSTIFAGMIKAPFMALIIGIISSVEGLKVGGSAESLGRRVTASVVKSIFVVIIVDGMFAMFYAAIDF
jgi:phospholipid/cholesterol/gamma-HCH transport system permease protein